MNLLNCVGEILGAVIAAHVGHLSAAAVVKHLTEILQLLNPPAQITT
jgi:hypothetical protein